MRKGDNVNIAEFAFITGMSKSTIRYYEDQKLLIPKRNANGYRMYSDEDIQDGKLITSLRKAGLSLEDIRLLIGVNFIIALFKNTKTYRISPLYFLKTEIMQLVAGLFVRLYDRQLALKRCK